MRPASKTGCVSPVPGSSALETPGLAPFLARWLPLPLCLSSYVYWSLPTSSILLLLQETSPAVLSGLATSHGV